MTCRGKNLNEPKTICSPSVATTAMLANRVTKEVSVVQPGNMRISVAPTNSVVTMLHSPGKDYLIAGRL